MNNILMYIDFNYDFYNFVLMYIFNIRCVLDVLSYGDRSITVEVPIRSMAIVECQRIYIKMLYVCIFYTYFTGMFQKYT